MKISTFRLAGRWNRPARAGTQMLLAAALLWGGAAAVAEPLSTSVLEQITALRTEKAARTPVQRKMDSHLVYALKLSKGESIAPGVNLRLAAAADARGLVTLDIQATVNPELLDFIAQSGGTVLHSSEQAELVRAEFPLAALEQLAGRADVRFLRPAYPPEFDTGSVTSEGDVTHTASTARAAFGVDGGGVKVGVLSDSVDFMAASQATGDLPPNVVVLAGQSGVPGSGEGTAMLEIIHDLAPGAELYFATAVGGEASFAQNILNLRAAGCDIIVDDVRYATESPFQDGVIARAVNTVTADGALYFASAGNSGNKAHGTSGTWEGDFANGGDAGAPVNGRNGQIHLFGTNTYNTVTAPGFSVSLFWADPLGASTNDYDLYVLDTNGTAVVSASTTVQSGAQDPFEIVPGGMTGERVVVVRVSGEDRFLHVDSGRGRLAENTTGFGRGHSAAAEAFATAAIDVATSYPNAFVGGAQNAVEDFSSDGPRRVFFYENGTAITPGNFSSTGGIVRQYPTVAAADGGMTAVPGFRPFYGTSAAAPHAAAVAALVKSYNNTLTAAQVRNALLVSALDIEAPGVDETGGYGIVMALRALTATPPPVPLPKLVVVTNYLAGGNGNGLVDFNECNQFDIVLTNIGRAAASGVRATLSTTTPGVIIAEPSGSYPNIPVNAGGTNFGSFRISTAPYFVCGTPIDLTLVVRCDQNATTNSWQISSGLPLPPLRFDNFSVAPIPDNSPAGVYSSIAVSNVESIISKVTVSLHIQHTYDGDLTVQLISPGGVTNRLVRHRGASGQNFGFACAPDSQRTTFDDAAPTSIVAGAPPYLGSYRPEQPLGRFAGTSGTNVNGIWLLRVVDDAAQDIGALQCWSLTFGTSACIDGGGECPGSDLAVGLTVAPEPAIVGDLLTYTIGVTNFGPSSAKSVTASQVLPSGVIYVSAVSSQGGCSYAGGVVTANLGAMQANGTATVTVVVQTTGAGVLTSSATVSSEQADFVSANNTAVAISHIQPPTADVAVGVASNPSSVSIGGAVTYTVAVTNNGPSIVFPVVVTNTYPPGILLRGQVLSQGTIISSANNTLVFNFGTLTNGGRATATISALAVTEGNQLVTATAVAPMLDPVLPNNTASVITIVGPSADLSLRVIDTPDPVVLYSNLTYRLVVSNQGPSTATSAALSFSLPVSAFVISNYTTQGTIAVSNSVVQCAFGNIASGGQVTLVFVVTPTVQGPLSAVAAVTAAQPDADLSNNAVTTVTEVSTAFVNIVPAGAMLMSESYQPANGSLDAGETVVISLRLRNAGNVNNTNLVATLVAGAGITPLPPNNPQTYGVLSAGGVPSGRSFNFRATGSPGGKVTAVLQLKDGTNALPNATYEFTFPNTFTFANTSAITIRDAATALPYPSTTRISGISGVVGKVTASLLDFTHTFPQDVEVLLVGPAGQKTILMAGAGGQGAVNLNLTFDDDADLVIPDATDQLFSTEYRPADYTGFRLPEPAPGLPYGAAMSALNGADPNGDWSLYVNDRSGGDEGLIAGGWTISLTTLAPVNQLADLSLSVTMPQSSPGVVASTLTYTFIVTNTGPNNASFVTFTNPLPAGVAFVSATSSQGTVNLVGEAVLGNLGPVGAGGYATVSVSLTPTASATGSLTNTAGIGSTETDLNPANNTASVVVPIRLPIADLGVAQSLRPVPAIASFPLTNSIEVVNRGGGLALESALNYTVPAGASVVLATSTLGTISTPPGRVRCDFGDLPAAAAATVTVVLVPATAGQLVSVASLETVSVDANPDDNSTSTTIAVNSPAPGIVIAGVSLVSESGPINGAVDPGETITVSIGLANDGSADAANLKATLLEQGGVQPANPAEQVYGRLSPGGDPIARPFTFIASQSSQGSVTATLRLADGANQLGLVSYVFSLPVRAGFENHAAIVVPQRGAANPYPSLINVTNLEGAVSKVVVTLRGITHPFPHDLSALLVNPAGANCLLLSRVGGGRSLNDGTLTLDDSATQVLPNQGQITNGTYRPSAYEGPVTLRSPAPVDPYGATLSALNGQSPNGAWLLYVMDDTTGDGGVIADGWDLEITTVQPINPLADLALTMSGSPDSLLTGQPLRYSLEVENLGPATATGVVVTDILPIGVSVSSSVPSKGTVSLGNGLVTWSVGQLDVGAKASLVLNTTPSQGGRLVNQASVDVLESDLNSGNNTAIVTTTVATTEPARLSGTITNGYFMLEITAQPGLTYVTEASASLSAQTWSPISTNTAPPTGTIKVVDEDAPGFGGRFYRATRQ